MKERRIPQRMCVGCREMKEKRALLRVVKQPDGAIAFDRTGRLAGRGAYLCPSAACLQRAMKTRQLERALETAIAPEVFEALGKALEAHG